MIWAAIALDIKTPLVFMPRDPDSRNKSYTAQSYVMTLEEGLKPVYEPGRLFQQDNARIHLASVAQEWFEKHGIWVIDWPAHSPDLNPIEHAWKAMKQHLYRLYPNMHELKDNEADNAILKARIEEAWSYVDQAYIRNLVASIPNRLAACRRAQGWYTKY